MRIALFSDTHGNLATLEAVLAEIQRDPVDHLICLGDVAIFGPQPRETLNLVRTLACPVVMGNTDAWALDPHPHAERNRDTPKFNAIELWSATQLSDNDRNFIRTFQPTVTLALDDDASLLAYHGSPRSFNEGIVATTADSTLVDYFADAQATVLAGGHTHAPFMRRWHDKIVLNPGSVGLPYETLADGSVRNPPWAEYAILTCEASRTNVELRRTPVDRAAVRAAVQQSAMPFGTWWLNEE